jgi:hypothetical protein
MQNCFIGGETDILGEMDPRSRPMELTTPPGHQHPCAHPAPPPCPGHADVSFPAQTASRCLMTLFFFSLRTLMALAPPNNAAVPPWLANLNADVAQIQVDFAQIQIDVAQLQGNVTLLLQKAEEQPILLVNCRAGQYYRGLAQSHRYEQWLGTPTCTSQPTDT